MLEIQPGPGAGGGVAREVPKEWPWVPGGNTAPHLVPLALVAPFTELQASLRLPPGFIRITSHWYPGLQEASLAFWVLFRGLSPSLY